jgi:hypothetical protein
MSDDDLDLMTVATFHSPMEAEVARSTLDGEGIPCVLADAETVNTTWLLSGAVGGIKLQVTKANFLAAERLLHSGRAKRKRDTVDDYGLPVRGDAITARRDAVTANPAQVPAPDDPESPEEEAAQVTVDTQDALLRRAFFVTFLATFMCPVIGNWYALFLIYQAEEIVPGLNPRQRIWARVLQVVNGLVLAGFVLFVLALWLFPGRRFF